EPTNFLNLPSVLWLETHLQQDLPPNTTVLFDSHDRTFTDAVAEEILVLRDLTLERFPGNLSSYEATRSEPQRYLVKMQDAQSRQRAHMQDTVAGNIRAAKATGDDKKLRQAASRQKKLDERMGYEVGMRGGRFKLNRDLPGYHTSMREGIDAIIPKDDPGIKVVLPSPGELRFPGPLISAEELRFAYRAGANVEGVGGKEVLTGVNLVVHPATRVGIVGLNGTGKSTLVRCLVDQSMQEGRITTGSVTRHPTARVGFFSQDVTEQLPLTKTALQVMIEGTGATDTTVDSHDARAALASVGLAGNSVSSISISKLSGGQKVRLALAMMLYPPPKLGPVPHVLVLDEVTTHLDADTVIVLAEELEKFEGALIVVSHDRWFVRQVVEGDDGVGTVFEVDWWN
ncbi:P-loop containing nucleoside triphosphate hydrolase protein, partial [Gymnopus androsaceus JB14]